MRNLIKPLLILGTFILLIILVYPEIRSYIWRYNLELDLYSEEYNKRILPIYLIDTLHIPSPRILQKDSLYFIISNNYCTDTINTDEMISNNKAIRCFSSNWWVWDLRFYYCNNKKLYEYYECTIPINEYFVDHYASWEKAGPNYTLYKFRARYKPESFLLISKASRIDPVYSLIKGTTDVYSDDHIIDLSFSNEYILTLAPMYTLELRNTMEYWDGLF